MPEWNRRQFVSALATSGPLVLHGARLFAGPAGSPRFLLVFLRGGYDCANALVPFASELYYEQRPTIAIARPRQEDVTGALALDAEWALAPVLRPTVGALFARRELAFVPFAGTDDLSRSHFETQDHIERGQPAVPVGDADFRSGFLARLSSRLTSGCAPPIAFTDALPRVFQGASVPNLSLRALDKPAFDDRQSAILASMYKGSALESAVDEGLELRHTVARELEQELRDANRDAVNPKGFEREARRIGRLLREPYRLGFVDVGGWDTHVGEGGAAGALATNLDSLGRGLLALADELGPLWTDTVVTVISEFGRTFRENGNKGTDHGHGSVYWVVGGKVAGGRIVGEQVALARENLFQDRDYPVLTDVRELLGGLFARLWGLSAADVEKIFPGAPARELGLL